MADNKFVSFKITGTSKPDSQEILKNLLVVPQDLKLMRSLTKNKYIKLVTESGDLVGYVKQDMADAIYDTIGLSRDVKKEHIKVYGGPTEDRYEIHLYTGAENLIKGDPDKYYGLSILYESDLDFNKIKHIKLAEKYDMIFGKYKGLKIETMIKEYPDYCVKMASYDGFKEKNGFLYNIFKAYELI